MAPFHYSPDLVPAAKVYSPCQTNTHHHKPMTDTGVSVAAVQAQLQLMGHTIPDTIIKAFLDSGPAGGCFWRQLCMYAL